MRRPDRSQGSARSKLLTLQDMADKFDVDKKTIARWIQNGIAHKAALVAGDIPTKGLLFQLPEPDGTLGRTRFWQRSEELRHKVDQLKKRITRREMDRPRLDGRKVWTTAEICEFIGVSPKSIQRYIKAGRLDGLEDNERWLPAPNWGRQGDGHRWLDSPEFRAQLAHLRQLVASGVRLPKLETGGRREWLVG